MNLKSLFYLLLLFTASKAGAQVIATTVAPVTATTIGRYEKFEAGIALNTDNFMNHFDADEIDVYAIFTYPATGATRRVNAFWYQDFDRDDNSPDPTEITPCNISAVEVPDPNFLRGKATPLPWRVRFAPTLEGPWTYQVFVKRGGQTTASGVYTFDCISSDKRGYIGVGMNNTHFVYKDADNPRKETEAFIPLGVNVMDYGSLVFNRACYKQAKRIIRETAKAKGNTIRIFMSADYFGLEWTEDGLGNYKSRQNRAFNLDDLFQTAEEEGVKIQLIVQSNHELNNMSDGAQNGYNFWMNNPYKPLLGTGNPVDSNQFDFYTSATSQYYFKRKLRYVIARWGYSPALLAYELWNESDIMVGAKPDVWNNGNTQKVKDWHNDMIAYAKTFDTKHMFTTSVGFTVVGLAGGNDNIPYYSSSSLDYVQDHYYSVDKNLLYNLSVFAQHSIKSYQKPYITGELGQTQCFAITHSYTRNSFSGGNYVHDMLEVHNILWSGLFNGSAGPAYDWHSRSMFSPCGGGVYKNYTSINNFLKDEDFFTKKLTFLTNTPTGDAGPKDAPAHNYDNNSMPIWSYPNYSSPSQLEARINRRIKTSNDREIDVFAARSPEGKIFGWVHTNENYWYKTTHYTVGDGSAYCASFQDNMPCQVSDVPTLDKASMTFENIECDGMYKVDYYSTYPQYDLDGDNVPEDGGIIAPFTQSWIQAYCGTLTVPIPKLRPISSISDGPYAPDYAFKITKIEDYWSHNWVTSNLSALNKLGSYNSDKLYYSDVNGAIRRVSLNTAANIYQFELVSAAAPPMSTAAYGPLQVNENGQVYYRGGDGRLQCYYFAGGVWNHIWLTDWANTSQNVGQYISSGPFNIFYQGADYRLHRYYFNSATSAWEHSLLPNANNANMNVGGAITVNQTNNHVFYKGQDNKLQGYYPVAGVYTHIWLTDWSSNAQNVAGDVEMVDQEIYYAGTDGYLHKYYFDNNTWYHTWIVDGNNQQIAIPANTEIALIGNADQIFFTAANGQIRHLFNKQGTNKYFLDEVICASDVQPAFKGNGTLMADNQKSLYYIGQDNTLQIYAFDNGCNPRSPGKEEARRGSEGSNSYVPLTTMPFNALSASEKSNDVSLSPNPFSDHLRITGGTSQYDEVSISDMIGRIYYRAPLSPGKDVKINTSAFPSGMYIITLMNQGKPMYQFKAVKL